MKDKVTQDIFDNPIWVGDTVAVAISNGQGCAPRMTYGVVNKITPKGATIKNRHGRLISILRFKERAVKVPDDFVLSRMNMV